MKYESKDATFRIEFVADPHPEENEPGEVVPEFRVRVSPVGNGWWTLSEVLALRDKLYDALPCREPDDGWYEPGTRVREKDTGTEWTVWHDYDWRGVVLHTPGDARFHRLAQRDTIEQAGKPADNETR